MAKDQEKNITLEMYWFVNVETKGIKQNKDKGK